MYHHLSLIGIKERIQSRVVDKESEKKYLIEIIAEKVTFLSSTSNKKTDEYDVNPNLETSIKKQ